MIIEKCKKYEVTQFLRFGIIGAINSILNILIYWVCIYLGVHYFIANAVGFVITVAISYVLNNKYTFSEKGISTEWSLRKLMRAYASYFVTGILLNSFLLWIWNERLGIDVNLAPVLNLFITVPLNFFINKFWVYRKSVKTKYL